LHGKVNLGIAILKVYGRNDKYKISLFNGSPKRRYN